MSIGTLTFWENHIPKEGELVYIIVGGKGFPSGVWKGVLTYVQDLGESRIVPMEEMVEYHTACKARIIDDRAPAEWRNKEPENCHVPPTCYDVYPDAPGMEQMLNKLFEQKGEVKALKKRLEMTEMTGRIYKQVLVDIVGLRSAEQIETGNKTAVDNVLRVESFLDELK